MVSVQRHRSIFIVLGKPTLSFLIDSDSEPLSLTISPFSSVDVFFVASKKGCPIFWGYIGIQHVYMSIVVVFSSAVGHALGLLNVDGGGPLPLLYWW